MNGFFYIRNTYISFCKHDMVMMRVKKNERSPLTDARLYGHRDICRILEVSGGTDSINDNPMTVRHEQDSNEVNFDISELNLQHSSKIEQVTNKN
ncbi:unnamed protein product, partial [Vitis vinifera]